MPRYAVTFRIHSDTTYDDRYNTFVEQVIKGASYWWDGTTSFYAIETTEELDAYCSRIYLKSNFSNLKDIFVVVNIETGVGRARGAITDKDLFKAFPKVTQL